MKGSGVRGELRLKLAPWVAELFGQLLKMVGFMPAGFCLGVPAQDEAGWSHDGNPLTENIMGWASCWRQPGGQIPWVVCRSSAELTRGCLAETGRHRPAGPMLMVGPRESSQEGPSLGGEPGCVPHRGLLVEGVQEIGLRSQKQVLHTSLPRDLVWKQGFNNARGSLDSEH